MSELYGDFSDRLRGDRWQPAMDVFETETSVVVRVEIAGVRGEDLRVHVDGELLRVSGVRQVAAEPKVRRLHQMEVDFGPFEREVRIAIPFDRDMVNANLEDGFLTITLPKRMVVRRQVEVETE
jgi:HSP20 family protein